MASITTIANQLIEDKAMRELNEAPDRSDPNRRGRPTVRVDLNPDAALAIATKISIDGVDLALVNFAGNIIARKNTLVATYDMQPDAFGTTLATIMREFFDENNLSSGAVAHIGIAAQGVTHSQKGTIAWSPAFRATNIPVVGPVEKETGVTCSIANDANMIAEGVMSSDRYRYIGTAAVVFMGYGVGMGLIIDGKVYHGATGASASKPCHHRMRLTGTLCWI